MEDSIFIIADAGGSKTHWILGGQKVQESVSFQSEGVNVAVNSDSQIKASIKSFLDFVNDKKLINIGDKVDLFFYAAGCGNEKSVQRLEMIFKELLPGFAPQLNFYSDLEAAALATFPNDEGICGILGTGSASCLCSNGKIIDRVPSLGYILGDEGSGAFMGKILLNRLYKRDLSNKIKVLLEEWKNVELQNVIEKIYRSPYANTFLASFVPFIKLYEEEEEISDLIEACLKLFFTRNVLKYKEAQAYKLRMVGGVAHTFSEQIKTLGNKYGIVVDKIIKQPIDELGNFYKSKFEK